MTRSALYTMRFAAVLAIVARAAQANPVILTDLYGFSGSEWLYGWMVASSLLIEYLAVRYLLRDWAKFRHVLPAFLLINAVTFPITHVLAIRYVWLAEALPITAEPLLYLGIFSVLRVDVPDLAWRIIKANAVSFVVGLLGYHGMVLLKEFVFER